MNMICSGLVSSVAFMASRNTFAKVMEEEE